MQANDYFVLASNFFKPLSGENNSDPSSPLPDNPDESIAELNTDQSQGQSCSNNSSLNIPEPICISESNLNDNDDYIDLKFRSKGLHIANLNDRHLMPKIDELRVTLSCENGPDIFGVCETFLDTNISDEQVAIGGYDFIRKDRCKTVNQTGGGVILYFRNSLNCRHKPELEISNIETLWSEIALQNSKPILVCTVYRPPNVHSNWIDLFEEELSIAQTTGLEIILMGDFNIDFTNCANKKWLNLLELFDLKQMVTSPTRVTKNSVSLIDHVYRSKPETISDCFVPHYSISDHFPVCIARKINVKVKKSSHTITTYRCFKRFNEEVFLSDLSNKFNNFALSQSVIEDDIDMWYGLFLNQLNTHAPLKTRRVKTKHLPEWFTYEIAHARKLRDYSKRMQNWADYKRYRNLTRTLIRKAKCKHFSKTVTDHKDTRSIWQHIRTTKNNSKTSLNVLPDELNIDSKVLKDSRDIASKLNEFFTTISKRINQNESISSTPDYIKIKNFVSNKVPEHIFFQIPPITPSLVSAFIQKLDPGKATGLDGVGPRVLKMACNIISPSIAALTNKSLTSSHFPNQLKLAKVFPIFENGSKSDPSIIAQYQFYLQSQKYSKNT